MWPLVHYDLERLGKPLFVDGLIFAKSICYFKTEECIGRVHKKQNEARFLFTYDFSSVFARKSILEPGNELW